MARTFELLKGEYGRLLASVQVTRPQEAEAAARKIFRNGNRYIEAGEMTGVPWPFIGVLDLRESDCNPSRGLGQGDPWNQVSTHVPRGKGPWKSWADAAKFYIEYDHLPLGGTPWTMEHVCWKGEAWNGYGPRNHGIFTGYLWAGTNHYKRGKYVADGVWDANHVDTQLGIIPVLAKMVEINPDTYIGDGSPIEPVPPPIHPDPEIEPYTIAEVMYIQGAMNILMPDSEELIRPDGNYGRRTARAVRNFQRHHPPLEVDGDAGPLTLPVIRQELARFGTPA